MVTIFVVYFDKPFMIDVAIYRVVKVFDKLSIPWAENDEDHGIRLNTSTMYKTTEPTLFFFFFVVEGLPPSLFFRQRQEKFPLLSLTRSRGISTW